MTYDLLESSSEDEIYKPIGLPARRQQHQGPAPLDVAVKELLDFNNSFLSKVLENIKENFHRKTTNELLEREFFAKLRIDELLQLHRKLKERLDLLSYSYIEIGNIFDELKDDFLIYCKITAQLRKTIDFLCDQMAENEEIRTCINNLQEAARQTNRQLEDPGPHVIKDLVAMLPQHVMRYHMVIENIQKQAAKGMRSRRTDVEREARRATDIMKNMTQHMGRVSKDYRYIIAMEEFQKEIYDFPYNSMPRMFGLLKTELKDIMLSQGSEIGPFKPFNLLVFNEEILALETITKEVNSQQTNIFKVPKKVKIEEKKFSISYKIGDIDHVYVKNVSHGHKTRVLLQVNAYKEAKIDKEKSFTLRLNDMDEASSLEKDMKDYVKEAKASAKIVAGSDHSDHKYEKFRANGNLDENINVRCKACDKLLEGLLFTAVRCITCDSFYHKECFSIEKGDEDSDINEEPVFEAPEDHLIEKLNDLELNDFDLGEVKRGIIVSKLKRRRPGTFALFSTKESNKFTLAVKNFEDVRSNNITWHIVQAIEINGIKNFSIERGTIASSLLDLVQKHRRSHFLYIPVTLESPPESSEEEYSSEASDLRENNDDVYSEEDITDEEAEADYSEVEYETTQSNISKAHLNYFYGDITREETEQMLVEHDTPGSFLVRQNDDTFKLSWMSFQRQLFHARIYQENGKFFVSMHKQFGSIHELVNFYQNFDDQSKSALSSPLEKNKRKQVSGRHLDQVCADNLK